MRLHNIFSTKEKRRILRSNMTRSEISLWAELKNDKLGYRFRRQFSIGQYIADFYCPKKKLVIEIDGRVHISQKEYDDVRDKFMTNFGTRVLRFTNKQVEDSLEQVLNIIKYNLSLE